MTPDLFDISCMLLQQITATNLCPVVHSGDEEAQPTAEGPRFADVHKGLQRRIKTHLDAIDRVYDGLCGGLQKIGESKRVMRGAPPLVLSLVWMPIAPDQKGKETPQMRYEIRGTEDWPAQMQEMIICSMNAACKAHLAAATFMQVGCLAHMA
jgi:hypothetical protein